MEGARAHIADAKAYMADAKAHMADAKAHMADTKAYTAGARALDQRMPSNRGSVFIRFSGSGQNTLIVRRKERHQSRA